MSTTNFKVGDFICDKSDLHPESCRVYQIFEVDVEFQRVKAMGVMEWRCNPRIRWGSLISHSNFESIAHYPAMLVIARVSNGEHICERPQHFVDLGVWTQQDRDEIIWGKRYP